MCQYPPKKHFMFSLCLSTLGPALLTLNSELLSTTTMFKPLYLAPSNAVAFNSSSPSLSSSTIPIPRTHFLLPCSNSTTFRCRNFRATMSSYAPPPPPESGVVVGFGMATVDFLATVDAYPKPDDKVRTTSFKIQGGGNAANALTCAARLGLKPKLISKVSDDAQGRGILKELEADGVDTSFFVVSKDASSTFSYVLVDNQTKTRTCFYTPGDPPMMPTDLSQSILLSAFNEARLVYFDGISTETALFVAHEAARNNICILAEAESMRAGLDELLSLADYVVCSASFPQAWTQAQTIPSALVSMLLRLPNIKFVIVTLGEDGCLMLERSITEGDDIEERDVDNVIESLYRRKDDSLVVPTCISSTVTKLRADGIGTVCGRLFVGTAEKIPACELTDSTGAGDAFIGAILYAICANMSPEKMLPFACQVAAANCRALGARAGLPHRTDPRLASFLS